jgi:hypothetical protein
MQRIDIAAIALQQGAVKPFGLGELAFLVQSPGPVERLARIQRSSPVLF